MANNTQTTASFLSENEREEKDNHIETRDNIFLQDITEREYVKSSNVIHLCAFIVAKPKFAFGKLISRISCLLYVLEFRSMWSSKCS